jgi:hypothetical protein
MERKLRKKIKKLEKKEKKEKKKKRRLKRNHEEMEGIAVEGNEELREQEIQKSEINKEEDVQINSQQQANEDMEIPEPEIE